MEGPTPFANSFAPLTNESLRWLCNQALGRLRSGTTLHEKTEAQYISEILTEEVERKIKPSKRHLDR